MQQMMSRYGGHNYLLGKGKASYQDLPEDQSLDNLLDNHMEDLLDFLLHVPLDKWTHFGLFSKLFYLSEF